MFRTTRQCADALGRPGRAALAALLLLTSAAHAAGGWGALIDPDNALSFGVLRDDRPVFHIALGGWGPNWSWVGLQARDRTEDGRLSTQVPFVVDRARGEVIDVRFEAWRPSPRQLSLRYDLESARDIPLTMLMAGFNFEPGRSRVTLTLEHPDGPPTRLALPVRGIRSAPATSRAELAFEQGGTVALQLDPPCPVGFDNGMRVVLASDRFRQGKRQVTLTFPEEVAFLATEADLDRYRRTLAGPDWFAFRPSKGPGPGVIDMDDWLERPAGRRAGIMREGSPLPPSKHT